MSSRAKKTPKKKATGQMIEDEQNDEEYDMEENSHEFSYGEYGDEMDLEVDSIYYFSQQP